MKRTSLVVAGFSAMVALGLIGYGCTSGDTVNNGTGGKGSGGMTTSGGQGGMTTSGGQGGMTTTGAGGSTTTGAGGSTTTGAGGSTTTGAGGSTTTGAGGSTTGGAGGSSGGVPTCPSPAPGDKSMCTLGATLVSPCTKNCGIKNSLAQKPCACITSTVMPPTAWDCSGQGPCVYPTGFDKTCYALTPAPPACPAALVTGLTTCTNTAGATCGPLCGSATVPSYSTGTIAMPSAAKAGYCACVSGLWQCASVAEWPM